MYDTRNDEDNVIDYNRSTRMFLELQEQIEKDEKTITVLIKTVKCVLYLLIAHTILLAGISINLFGW